MANQWLRLWHDMPNDPKWRTIAKVSGQPVASVLAVYLHLLVNASNATERGRTHGIASEDLASALDVETDQIEKIMAAMQGRVLDGDYLTGWKSRQPEREDGASERAKRWREAKKAEQQTQPNATERKQTLDKDKDTDTETDKSKTKGRAAPFVLPEQIKPEVWKDWHDYRNTKKGWTAKAKQLSLNTLLALVAKGHDPQKIINTSIERGWTGLFEPKADPKQNVVRPIQTKPVRLSPQEAAAKRISDAKAWASAQVGLGAMTIDQARAHVDSVRQKVAA